MTPLSHSGGPGFNSRFLYFGFICDDCGDDIEAGPFRPSAGNQVEHWILPVLDSFYTWMWPTNTLSLDIGFRLRVSYSDRAVNELLNGPNVAFKTLTEDEISHFCWGPFFLEQAVLIHNWKIVQFTLVFCTWLILKTFKGYPTIIILY